MTAFAYTLLARDGRARRGRIDTAHGAVATPAFMPVGTAATVKAMTVPMLAETGAEMVLANAYHLMLRPGDTRVAALGGLHRFMGWRGPILTDSGGYQVMSLAALRTIEEDGVTFRSHLDGARHRLTPERATEVQHNLDATVSMVLDECIATPAPIDAAAIAMERSMRWAERSRRAFRARPGYGQFGIVQGALFPELRLRSAEALVAMDFEGHAVGGLAVGEGQAEMFRILDVTVPALPETKPRYLMGVGKPSDIVGAVARGIDLFDCVLPTRSGRTAQAFTRAGALNLRNARFAEDEAPLDPACACLACGLHSRAYLHHLVKAGEILAAVLLTQHNLTYYQDLMRALRTAIPEGRLAEAAAAMGASPTEPEVEP